MQIAELKLSVDVLEKERDFYFMKLRDIEILCQTPDVENLAVIFSMPFSPCVGPFFTLKFSRRFKFSSLLKAVSYPRETFSLPSMWSIHLVDDFYTVDKITMHKGVRELTFNY